MPATLREAGTVNVEYLDATMFRITGPFDLQIVLKVLSCSKHFVLSSASVRSSVLAVITVDARLGCSINKQHHCIIAGFNVSCHRRASYTVWVVYANLRTRKLRGARERFLYSRLTVRARRRVRIIIGPLSSTIVVHSPPTFFWIAQTWLRLLVLTFILLLLCPSWAVSRNTLYQATTRVSIDNVRGRVAVTTEAAHGAVIRISGPTVLRANHLNRGIDILRVLRQHLLGPTLPINRVQLARTAGEREAHRCIDLTKQLAGIHALEQHPVPPSVPRP
jgi:hypothetical protein